MSFERGLWGEIENGVILSINQTLSWSSFSLIATSP